MKKRAQSPSHQLSRLEDHNDFKVHHEDPDLRGWIVKGQYGEPIGTVENLIVDVDAQKVRYLEIKPTDQLIAYATRQNTVDTPDNVSSSVATPDSSWQSQEDPHLLIPIGLVRLNEEQDEVIADSLSTDHFTQFPCYECGKDIDGTYEESLQQSLHRIHRESDAKSKSDNREIDKANTHSRHLYESSAPENSFQRRDADRHELATPSENQVDNTPRVHNQDLRDKAPAYRRANRPEAESDSSADQQRKSPAYYASDSKADPRFAERASRADGDTADFYDNEYFNDKWIGGQRNRQIDA